MFTRMPTVPPSPISQKSVIKKFKKHFKRGAIDFDIELYEGVLYVHNSIHLIIEIPFTDAKSKKRIYNALWLLPDMFDFSFTVEAYDIETLENFVMSGLVTRQTQSTAFGDMEETHRRRYRIITDNLHLQTGDHVVDLYRDNPDSINLRRGLIKAVKGDIKTIELSCHYHSPKPKKGGDAYESIVTKMTVSIKKSLTEDGRTVNEIIAMNEEGVSAWIEFKGDAKGLPNFLIQPLRIEMMYRYWYVDILQACFNEMNKNHKEVWMVASKIRDINEVA